MTRIIYKRRYNALPDEEGAIILTKISGADDSEVMFSLEELPSGYLVIDKAKHHVTSGTVTLDLSSLGDGLYTPMYIVGARALLCSPFVKRGHMLLRPLPDGEDISRLELMISNLSERIAKLEVQSTVLQKKIDSPSLEI